MVALFSKEDSPAARLLQDLSSQTLKPAKLIIGGSSIKFTRSEHKFATVTDEIIYLAAVVILIQLSGAL